MPPRRAEAPTEPNQAPGGRPSRKIEPIDGLPGAAQVSPEEEGLAPAFPGGPGGGDLGEGEGGVEGVGLVHEGDVGAEGLAVLRGQPGAEGAGEAVRK